MVFFGRLLITKCFVGTRLTSSCQHSDNWNPSWDRSKWIVSTNIAQRVSEIGVMPMSRNRIDSVNVIFNLWLNIVLSQNKMHNWNWFLVMIKYRLCIYSVNAVFDVIDNAIHISKLLWLICLWSSTGLWLDIKLVNSNY